MQKKYQEEANGNLFLTGFMGSGKSTIGKLLSQKLERKFFDLDQQIEEYLGISVFEVIEKFGIDYFRKIENQKLAILCTQKKAVVALGGGTLISTKNLEQVQKSGKLIYLMTPENAIFERLKKTTTRPLFKNLDKDVFDRLFKERIDGYMKADFCLQTGDNRPDSICSMILLQVKDLENAE